jgi:glycosyltransferase involved in cell wall biosynthesis
MAAPRPTVLQIIPELDTGGAELSTIEIAAALVKAGARALVLSEGGRMSDRLKAAGGELIPFPAAAKNPATLLINARRIAAIARREGVDLIHARSRAPAWSALLAARKLKVPFITTYHGAYNEGSKAKNLYNSVMARGETVIANSHYTAGLIKSRYGTADDRIRVIYRGVDVDGFNPDAVAADRIAALRSRWSVDDHTRVVLHAARLTAWKGQRQIIDAAARMKDKLGDVVFIMAGDAQGRDGYVTELEHAIAANGLQGKVRLVGHVDDMPAAFAAAHVAFVGSIEPEAFGRAGAEAQAIGCPVISTNIGAPPETVKAPPRVTAEDRTGWLVPPGDLAAYELALSEALALTPTQRAAMAKRARRNVLDTFTTAAMQRQTLEVYDKHLGTDLARRFDL